ncbi:MAG: 30S ribosome-binding factor RbfA [Tissierellales bacterium]|jgi:ribosome-binding factor A|nr:30S ribosome-binding factor RbfA [Tissierellales bacterium]
MGQNRAMRVGEQIRKLISELIFKGQIKNAQLSTLTSITSVEVSGDLKYAKVYVSVLGQEGERRDSIEALEKSKGFIRKYISQNMKIHHVPALTFELDTSIENGIYMAKKIDEVLGGKNDPDED